MTKTTGTTVPTITQQAHDAADSPGTLLGLLHHPDATIADREYVTSLLLASEGRVRTDRMVDRITRMGNVGESLVSLAIAHYDAGDVKDVKGEPIVLSSDDRADLTMANLRRGLGMTERTDRYAFGPDQAVAYTDLQRYWQAARASEEDVQRALVTAEADGFADNVAKVVAAVASETFRRTDPIKAADAAKKRDEAKAKRDAAKDEAKAEEEHLTAVSGDLSPITVDESWSLDQLRAIVIVVHARIATVKAEAKAEAAKRAEEDKAFELVAKATGKTVDEVRAMMTADTPQTDEVPAS